MKIFEARGKIKDIKDARNVAEKIGGIFKGFYSRTDIIFKDEKSDSEKGITSLMIFEINNRQTQNYIFIHKIAEWSSDKTKTDKIVLKGKFDTMGDVLDFIVDNYGDGLKEDYRYSREGWEYSFDKCEIFIECIEKLGPTIEIEAENKSDLENLFKLFDVSERFSESTPEIMRKLVENPMEIVEIMGIHYIS